MRPNAHSQGLRRGERQEGRQDERHGPAGPVLSRKILDKAARFEAAGRLREAEAQYRRLLEVRPDHAGASYRLGLLAARAGEAARAVPLLVAALRAEPGEAAHWFGLAEALVAAGRLAEARAILERLPDQGFPEESLRAARQPLVSRLYAVALRLFNAERFAEAEAHVDALLLVDDRHAEAINLAASIAGRTNRPQRAIDLLTIAVYIDPGNSDYFSNLGVAFSNHGNDEAAIAALEKAIALDPESYAPRVNVADIYRDRDRLDDALAALRAATALRPDALGARNGLAVVLKQLGRIGDAVEAFEAALRIDPDQPSIRSNLIMAKLYSEAPAEEIFALCREFGRLHADPHARTRPFANARGTQRPLRIGFVSADLCNHAVANLFEPCIAHLDRTRFETFAYSNNRQDDAVTARLKGYFAQWREIAALDDDAAAALIEGDRIDVLVDLSGHSGFHRLLVFARRPAPVQATWIGCPASTGLTAMDYRITDAVYEPEGSTDHLHTERLWRLPGVNSCYLPQGRVPEPAGRPPFAANGHVTFGCFNRIEKVSEAALRAWARILAAVPDARMLFEVVGIDDPRTRAGVERRLAEAGLPLERIAFEPRLARNRYVLYDRIDIALDPFPYNGGTTSLDTLHMGVPFVALEGERTVSRMGVSILRVAGCPELCATDEDAYVALACRLAADHAALRHYRATLRSRMQASAHMDYRRHAEEIGAAFETMWRRWLEADAVSDGRTD